MPRNFRLKNSRLVPKPYCKDTTCEHHQSTPSQSMNHKFEYHYCSNSILCGSTCREDVVAYYCIKKKILSFGHSKGFYLSKSFMELLTSDINRGLGLCIDAGCGECITADRLKEVLLTVLPEVVHLEDDQIVADYNKDEYFKE